MGCSPFLRLKLFAVLALVSLGCLATTAVAKSTKFSDLDVVAIATKQERLIQQMAMNYFYLKQNLVEPSATSSLMVSMKNYRVNRRILASMVREEDDLFMLIDLLAEDYLVLVSGKSFGQEFSARVINMSEALTEAYQDLAKSLLLSAENPELGRYIHRVEEMGMLITRLAKYYAAFTSGYSDASTLSALRETAYKFDQELANLSSHRHSNPFMRAEMEKIVGWWRVMRRFYVSVDERQLPVVVLATTDKIMQKVDIVGAHFADSLKQLF